MHISKTTVGTVTHDHTVTRTVAVGRPLPGESGAQVWERECRVRGEPVEQVGNEVPGLCGGQLYLLTVLEGELARDLGKDINNIVALTLT